MKLRHQLIVLSLITLVLPWAGIQYVRQMDSAMRELQLHSLSEQAKMVATSLEQQLLDQGLLEQGLLEQGLRRSTIPEAGETLTISPSLFGGSSQLAQRFYLHLLPSDINVDGYADDWRSLAYVIDAQHFADSKLNLQFATYGDDLLLFVRVKDQDRRYFNPSLGLSAADYFSLSFRSKLGGAQTLDIFTSAPGRVLLASNKEQPAVSGTEHWLKGVWQETESGISLELRMPLRFFEQGFALQYFDASSGSIAATPWSQLIVPRKAFQSLLHPFLREDIHLQLMNEQGYILADVGAVADSTKTLHSTWQELLGLLLRAATTERREQVYQAAYSSGQDPNIQRFQTRLNKASPPSQSASFQIWARQGRERVVSITQALRVGETRAAEDQNAPALAWIKIEQSSASMSSPLDSASGELMLYSILASALAGIALLVYATWLSWRVKRLSSMANLAVDQQGKILQEFKASTNRDELGELSRSFRSLLQRLQAYTHYLESLAAKLSHELRTPLAVVKTSLDNLAVQTHPPESQTYIDRAQEGCSRLSSILNAMSEASRLEQSLEASERENIDIALLLGELVAAYQDIYPRHQIVLTVEDKLDSQLLCAPELLVQAIDKLVENASDFCPPGGRIEFTITPGKHSGLILSIWNSGSQLPEGESQQLFDSLISHRSSTLNKQHLGLGLYIVRTIVAFHGGQVRAYNDELGQGVFFEIILPKS